MAFHTVCAIIKDINDEIIEQNEAIEGKQEVDGVKKYKADLKSIRGGRKEH